MIKENAELIPSEYIERAKKLGAAELCDAMTALKIDVPQSGCMSPYINAVSKEMKTVGTAATIETSDGNNFPIHLACYNSDSEGYVLVVDGKGCSERAYAGDLIFATCQAVGYEGFIIDGYTRDKLGNIALGFPVWSRGFTPGSPKKVNEGNVNTPIECGGVKVNPGDLVVGDADGVCVVPRNFIDPVLRKAEEKEEYEKSRRLSIARYIEAKRKNEELPSICPQWVLDIKNK